MEHTFVLMEDKMSNWLNYTVLHATNPKLTRAVFSAVVDIRTRRQAGRLAHFAALGQAVLAHASALYGPALRESLWLALRPQRVEAALAANKDLWLQRVVGMLVEYDLARTLVNQPVQQPISHAALTDDQRKWTKAHDLPTRVGAWVFHGTLTQATGWQLLRQQAPDIPAAELAAYLQVPPAALKRAVQVLLPVFAPLPQTWQQLVEPVAAPAPQAAAKPNQARLAADPELLHTVQHALRHAQQASLHQVLPLALDLASLINAVRQFSRIKSLHIVAPTITSGGLHELAHTLDQALVIDQAQVAIVCGGQQLTPSCAADLQELQQAGAALWTPANRPLGAHLLSVAFEEASLTIIGSSDVSTGDYHTSLELDTLTVAAADPTASWWASLQPMLKPLMPHVASPIRRERLLAHGGDALANFKAQIAQVKDTDTHQRLVAWLRYAPKPPVAMQLGAVAYFALAFPQYHTVVIDTFTPNNALFYAKDLPAARLAVATSKRALQALGAKRAYHTNEPIRQRVSRILGV